MVRYFVSGMILAVAVAGCGPLSSGDSHPQTHVRYIDPRYHFSFELPTGWKVPKNGGHLQNDPSTGNTYHLTVMSAGNKVGFEVTVDKDLTPYSNVPEGKVIPDPMGGPDTFKFHHLKVAGWPALQSERFNGTELDSYETQVNTANYSYDFQMITGTPPFTADQVDAYNLILRTAKLPF